MNLYNSGISRKLCVGAFTDTCTDSETRTMNSISCGVGIDERGYHEVGRGGVAGLGQGANMDETDGNMIQLPQSMMIIQID